MNTKNFVRFGLLLGTVLSANAFGQTCNATGGGLAGPSSANLDLCTFTDQLTKDCGNSTTIGNANDAIFSFSLAAGNNTTITVTPASTYSAYVGIMSGAACNSTDTCGSTENVSASNGAATTTTTNGLSAGSYFLIVSNINDTTCGTFTLAVSGALPVELQNFSVN